MKSRETFPRQFLARTWVPNKNQYKVGRSTPQLPSPEIRPCAGSWDANGAGLSRAAQAAAPQARAGGRLCSTVRTAVTAEGEEQQLYTALDRRRLLWPVGATAKAERGATQALLPSPLYAGVLNASQLRSDERGEFPLGEREEA